DHAGPVLALMGQLQDRQPTAVEGAPARRSGLQPSPAQPASRRLGRQPQLGRRDRVMTSSRSQSRMSVSYPVAASVLPSGANATPISRSTEPPTRPSSAPVATLHTRKVPSSLAAASSRPSGEKATGFREREWRPMSRSKRPDFTSQSRTGPSRG